MCGYDIEWREEVCVVFVGWGWVGRLGVGNFFGNDGWGLLCGWFGWGMEDWEGGNWVYGVVRMVGWWYW